jgi:hypothetical protein
MQIRSVGIDLGKTTFHLVALGDNGKVLLKKKFAQKQLIAFTANTQTCLIRGVSHQGQEKTLHLKAGYIDADFPSSQHFSLAFTRRTHTFGNFKRPAC